MAYLFPLYGDAALRRFARVECCGWITSHLRSRCTFGSMAQARWINDLRKAGLNTSEERLVVVAQVLVCNRLTSLRRLRAAGDPICWPGSKVLQADEIEFLTHKVTGAGRHARSRSRSREVVRHEVDVPATQVISFVYVCQVVSGCRVVEDSQQSEASAGGSAPRSSQVGRVALQFRSPCYLCVL